VVWSNHEQEGPRNELNEKKIEGYLDRGLASVGTVGARRGGCLVSGLDGCGERTALDTQLDEGWQA